MEQGGFDLAPAQLFGKCRDLLNPGLSQVKGPVDQVKKRFAAEIGNSRRVRPYDAPPRPVPQPGRAGEGAQIFKRWRLWSGQYTRSRGLSGRSPRNYEHPGRSFAVGPPAGKLNQFFKIASTFG